MTTNIDHEWETLVGMGVWESGGPGCCGLKSRRRDGVTEKVDEGGAQTNLRR